MAITLGRNASVAVGSSGVGRLVSCALTGEPEIVAVTVCGSSAREYVETGRIRNFTTVTGEAIFDSADSAQDVLRLKTQGNTRAYWHFYPEGKSTGKDEWYGYAFLESLDVSADGDGAVRMTFTLKSQTGFIPGTVA